MDLSLVGVSELRAISDYLLANGWCMNGALFDKQATVWHRLDNKDAEILLPGTPHIKDYKARLRDLFAALGEVENRPQRDVYFSILDSVNIVSDKRNGTLADVESGLTHQAITNRVFKWIKKHHSKVAIRDPFRSANHEQPDVIAWRLECSILIECKVSRVDFLSDKNKPFRGDPDKGMGDWRFYASPPGVINVSDLPDKWGLLWVYPKMIRKVHGWPPNTRWINDKPFKRKNETAETTMLVSALRRLELKGYMDSIYDKDYGRSK